MNLRQSGLAAVAVAVAMFAGARAANAAIASFHVTMDGPSESPVNASPGTGLGTVDWDTGTHTMTIDGSFTGLLGTTTASHIHAATAVAFAGTAGVATTTPSFPGFPLGVTSGVYHHVFDMTDAGSYNPSFVTANGGTTGSAEAALFQAALDGKAYWNIHSTVVPGGEIRGFLIQVPEPASAAALGAVGLVALVSRRKR